MLQLALPTSWRIPADDRRMVVVGKVGKVAVQSTVLADSVTALAALGHEHIAVGELSRSGDLWQPTPADPFGDPARVAARLDSPRTRRTLVPLADTLAARPGADARELARAARKVAAVA